MGAAVKPLPLARMVMEARKIAKEGAVLRDIAHCVSEPVCPDSGVDANKQLDDCKMGEGEANQSQERNSRASFGFQENVGWDQ